MSRRVHTEIDCALGDWGDHPALIEATPGKPTRVVSATELRTGIRETADYLARSGIGAGVPVALVLDSSIDFVRIFLALLRAAALPVPLSPDYRTLELDEIFANSRPSAVIVGTQYVEPLARYLEGRTVFSCREGALRVEREAPAKPEPADLDAEVASLNYTYRGCGYPLGCEVTHGQYLHGARVLQDGLQGSRGERTLSNLPMYHIFPLVSCTLVPLLYRMTSVVARTMHPRHLFRIIEEQGLDYVTGVPELFLLLAKVKDGSVRLPTLKAFVSGGSSLGAEEYEDIRQAFGVDLLHGYGLTEFAPVSRNTRGHARAGTIGPLCAAVDARIEAPDGKGNGEILLSTPFMSRAYHRRPRETEEAYRDGWFHSGDLGRFEDNHLVFAGVRKPTCKVNGRMVDLEEVRRAILLDPEVADAEVRDERGVLTARIDIPSSVDFQSKSLGLVVSLGARVSAHKIPRRIIRGSRTQALIP